jgi:putative toxin-antitoxin system antitoxin component (TIGR02293 family)
MVAVATSKRRPSTAAKPAEDLAYREVIGLFGGGRVLGSHIHGPLDAHNLLTRGLPGAALSHLVAETSFLKDEATFEKAVGMSLRTFQRRKEAPDKPLSVEQSGRAWSFAELFAKATAVLGARDAAERWFETPAAALDQSCPLDLISTPAGRQMVEDLLGRMEYGVYT